ncbi:hypothetical protein ABZV65_32040 [Streptomyces bauhiniae]|uniref:hypothetical protein n=1 Tax=Streptomyces bauhiniae TaxID=2340725 RepID=UPI0033AD7E5A
MRRDSGAVEYRIRPVQTAVPVAAGMALAVGILYVALHFTADPMSASELRTCLCAAVAGVLGVMILPGARGARLTDEHLVVLAISGRRERQIRWTDITGIEVRTSVGVRRVRVALASGEQLTLPAPISFLDRHFDPNVGQLTGWWQARRQPARP